MHLVGLNGWDFPAVDLQLHGRQVGINFDLGGRLLSRRRAPGGDVNHRRFAPVGLIEEIDILFDLVILRYHPLVVDADRAALIFFAWRRNRTSSR